MQPTVENQRAELRSVCSRIIPEMTEYGNLALPELLKHAAMTCFLYPERFENADMQCIRQALLYLEEFGTVTKS